MKKLFILFFSLVIFSSYAQMNEVQLSVHLKNGDILTGSSELTQIVFKTDYGSLNIPIDQVNTLDIGLKDNRFDKANLLSLLDKLDYGSDKEKESAFDQILEMDEGAIPFIKAFLSASPGGNSSASDLSVQTLYEVMLAKYKISRNYSLFDILTYKNEFRIEGSYEFTSIVIDTDYGRIKVERNNIARIDVKMSNEGINSKNSFKLFASENISGNKNEGWLNTGILVKKGDKIKINASGQIVLASLSGSVYTSDGGVNGALGPEDTKLNYGQVVFKISQGGQETKAGDNYNGYASQTGILYLAIYESVYNSANSGYYTVNLKVD